ncbi:hypothetical protein K503DRAFT_715931 [Rhizopogon vinicolor AM-OR11-026]|uniref:Uncharacterized protein n=1 Tax=Rhizopogon vinicolor AM-OR11-026 TaxID=1314800 RepID=A0A1B7N4C8_9AGAM|nr:hypothetical protein K503DRAFT_715931 [Rhizopogon vinicolor AM-OR11-026]
MASWIDIFSFLTITLLFGGSVLGVVLIAQRISAAAQNTKEALQNKGISISDKGVSVKTSKRFDREHYVDATQRGIIKVVGASTFRSNNPDDSQHNAKSKSTTNLSVADDAPRSEKKLFGIRRAHSGASK